MMRKTRGQRRNGYDLHAFFIFFKGQSSEGARMLFLNRLTYYFTKNYFLISNKIKNYTQNNPLIS